MEEAAHLLGFAALDPPLRVTDVQVLWVLRVEVGHDVDPPEKQSLRVQRARANRSANGGGVLLFAVNGRVFPAGLSDQDPVLHLVGGKRSPVHNTGVSTTL